MVHAAAGVRFLSLCIKFQGLSTLLSVAVCPFVAGWHPGCGQAVFCPLVCQLMEVVVVPRFGLLGGAPSAGV